MSTASQQDVARREEKSQSSGLMTAIIFKQSFHDLPLEIEVMILQRMTATEIIDFRCCSVAFNTIYLHNESMIVRGILKNHFYHAASTLYGLVSNPGLRRFEDLKQIARRCDIADMLATSVAEHYVGECPTTSRMANNIKPYLLSIGHFYENYRAGLINVPPRQARDRSFSSRVEQEILNRCYNRQTAQRICLTHHLLDEMLVQKFGRDRIFRLVPLEDFMELLWRPNIEFYLFGGLEMIKDILTHPRPCDRFNYTLSHLLKTTLEPCDFAEATTPIVNLPPSVLGPRLERAAFVQIYRLLPPEPVLEVSTAIAMAGLHPLSVDKERAMNEEFLEYLKSYEGEEPELVN